MMSQGPKHRTAALTLVAGAAICAGLLPAHTAPPSGVRKSARVGLLPVMNLSKVRGEELAGDAFNLFVRAMRERKEFSVTTLESIPENDPLSEYGLELTPDQQTMVDKLSDVDVVVRFAITQEGTYETRKRGRKYSAVEIQGRAVSTKDGLLVGRTYSRGAQYEDEKGELVDNRKLLQSAIVDAVDQLVELIYIRGSVGVKPVDEPQMVISTIGTLDGIRPGAEFAFYDDDDELIGYGKAVNTDDAYTLIKLVRGSSYARTDIGTNVRPIYNPPTYADGYTMSQLDERALRREEIRFGLACALTWLGFEVYQNNFSGSSGSSGPPSPPAPPAPPPP
ncbi:MAG: hypothetical protein COZ56_06800 [Armatimonadetes bacterium CG_4_8_14_3_um_filter_58_9]|nr:MAG: hypothetical protein COZ56_06800 [Armatimonadetes bacterium CG_4_8_14_3_um_filter_58_9]